MDHTTEAIAPMTPANRQPPADRKTAGQATKAAAPKRSAGHPVDEYHVPPALTGRDFWTAR